jgi:uncharacterized RDD family membrane protein YckC
VTESAQRRLIIRTPEGVEFSLVLAGPMTRFLAWAIDAAAIGLASSMIGKLLTLLALISPDLAVASSTLSYFVLSIGYGIGMEWLWRGQTLGKRVLGLRVMDARGLKLHVSQIAIRNVLRTVDILPLLYMVGGIACAVNRYSQRLGDIAANTVVVRRQPLDIPDAGALVGDRYNSMLAYPHLTTRLRHRAKPEAVEIALDALHRRDTLDPLFRLRVFDELAAHFRGLVEFPEEATLQITSEQYVRNCVGAILRPAGGSVVRPAITQEVRVTAS